MGTGPAAPAAIAKMTILWLGGIKRPCIALDIVRAQVNPLSYPFFSITGIIIEPSEATSAVGEPEIPPKNIESTQLTIASPPRIHPTHAFAIRTSLSVIPPADIISPNRMKKGTAIKEKEFSPLTVCCATVCSGIPRYNIVISVDTPIENKI